jgi:hypothetical protein
MDISEEDYQKAVAVVMDCSSGSVSNLQRKLYWGYGRAAAAIDRMQDEFIVSSMSASGRRDVYPEEIHQLWKELQVAKAQVPEWISVNDQMPPTDETVLVCWDYAQDIEPDKEYTTIDENLDEYWPNCQDEPPTHWMPIPKVIEVQEQNHD